MWNAFRAPPKWQRTSREFAKTWVFPDLSVDHGRGRAKSHAPRRFVTSGSGYRRTVKSRRRLAVQARIRPSKAGGYWRRGRYDRRQLGRNGENAHHRATQSRAGLPIMIVPLRTSRIRVVRMVMLRSTMVRPLRVRMPGSGGLVHVDHGRRRFAETGSRRRAERKRGARCQHAKQVRQRDDPSRDGPLRFRQSCQHGLPGHSLFPRCCKIPSRLGPPRTLDSGPRHTCDMALLAIQNAMPTIIVAVSDTNRSETLRPQPTQAHFSSLFSTYTAYKTEIAPSARTEPPC